MDRYAAIKAALDDGWVQSVHQDTVRALLAERDALIHDNDEYVSAANELATENQRLREALQSIVDCCDEDHAARDYSSRQTAIRGIARYALAQGQINATKT